MRSERNKHEKSGTYQKHARQDEPKQKKSAGKKHSPLIALLLIILLLLAAIAGTAWYFYKTAFDSLSVTFKDDSPEIKFGTDCPVMDYVADYEGELTTESGVLDTSNTGNRQMVYTVTQPVLGGLLNPSKQFILDYTVVDTEPPLKIWGGDGTVLERGGKFDINEIIAYGDNADPSPSVDVKGKVDMTTSGDYPLHITLTDASGNSTDWDLTVTVADSLPAYEDTSEKTSFKDFMSDHKGEGKAFGIDVSAWQDEIDFRAVKKAGCEFVMIRIGYGSGSNIEVDKRFYSNINAARSAGLKIGVYLYSYDNSEESAREAADWVLKVLDGEKLDLPVVYDWEDFGSFQTYDMNFYELNKTFDAFADEIRSAGYDCMLYSSKSYLENIWSDTEERPVWLAHYTDKTDYKDPYMMWQASCTGRIEGIDGDVDMDILY